jgi:short-subunit dehydrogenase
MHYILTGCSSGLGYEITRDLLNANFDVVGLSRSIGKASSLIDHEHFQHISCDLRNDAYLSEIDYLMDGRDICIIVNAASFRYEGDEPLNMADFRELFDVNFFSAVSLVEKFKCQGLKRVLFINSVAGKVAQQGQAQYGASKHALQAYSETLSKYSVGKGFDVMTINPGGIDTELWSGEEVLEKVVTDTFIQPTVLSGLICTLLRLPYKTYIQSAIILPEHDI